MALSTAEGIKFKRAVKT